jgi:signal transduction histidine kinase
LWQAFKQIGLSSLVFVPVGPRDNRVAMLFLGYCKPELLTDLSKLTLRGLGAAIESSYNLRSPWPTELHHLGIRIHHVIARMQGTFARLDRVRGAIRQLSLGEYTNDPIENVLDDIEADILNFRQEIKHATLQERYDLSKVALLEALDHAANDFIEAQPERLRIRVDVDERIQEQSLFVRQLLFWIAVEGMANAVEHGKAKLIDVQIDHDPGLIMATIIDNGDGLSPQHSTKQPYGIYHLKRLALQTVGATLDIIDSKPRGVRVELRLPIRRQ